MSFGFYTKVVVGVRYMRLFVFLLFILSPHVGHASLERTM